MEPPGAPRSLWGLPWVPKEPLVLKDLPWMYVLVKCVLWTPKSSYTCLVDFGLRSFALCWHTAQIHDNSAAPTWLVSNKGHEKKILQDYGCSDDLIKPYSQGAHLGLKPEQLRTL